MSPQSSITGLCAALMAIAFSALPADARQKSSDAQYVSDKRPVAARQVGSNGVPSFDGRYTGRPRTCGFDTFQNNGTRFPTGPYCH